MTTPTTLHSVADVAAMFGPDITERWVLEQRLKRGWPCIKVGHVIRFTDEHIALILSRHTVTAAEPPEESSVLRLEGQTKRSARRSA